MVNNQKFVIDTKNWINKKLEDAQMIIDKITLDSFGDIVAMTPAVTGEARGGWQCTIGQPASSYNSREDKSGMSVQAEINNVISGQKGDGKRCLSNLKPYILVLENGGYPDPPKYGTWVKGKGYVIRSVGGYSKQAPAGMVKVTVARYGATSDEAARKADW